MHMAKHVFEILGEQYVLYKWIQELQKIMLSSDIIGIGRKSCTSSKWKILHKKVYANFYSIFLYTQNYLSRIVIKCTDKIFAICTFSGLFN